MDSKEIIKRVFNLSYAEIKEFDSPNMFFPTATQFLETCLPQEFPLPLNIMRYIWTNPSSPELYHKMIKCCKLFFLKNPILVMKAMHYSFYFGWQYCNECLDNNCNHVNYIMLDNIKAKFWITKRFNVYSNEALKPQSTFASSFIPRIYQCEVEYLSLFHENLFYDELKFLSSAVKVNDIYDCTVKYKSGEDVPLIEVLKLFKAGKRFVLTYMKSAAFESYNKFIDACSTFEEVELRGVPDDFDIPEFYRCLKKSKNRTMITISAKVDNDAIKAVAAEILQTNSFHFVPPVICCLSYDEQRAMERIQQKEFAKYRYIG